MHKNKCLIVISVCLLISIDIYAGHGLSNEVYLTRQWRDLETPRSVVVNPSFAAYSDWITVSSAFSMTQFNRFYLANLQGIVPLTPLAYKSHTIGAGYIGYSSGKFDRTVWNRNRIIRQEEGNKYSEHYGTLSYAMQPFTFLSVGTNVNIAYQNNFGNPVIDGAFDIGASYLIDNAKTGKHVIGICFLNPAGISRYEKPVYSPDVGISWGFEKEIKSIDFNGGIEFNYRSFWGEYFGSSRVDVTGRLGAKINKMLQLYLQGGNDYFGFSINFNFDTTSKKLPDVMKSISTAMQVLFTKEQFAPTNTIYLAGEFGKNRNVIRGDANEIYQKARKKLANEYYMEAYALFSLLEKKYQRFIKIDEVRMLSAFCLEKMFLYDKSMEKYNQVKELYTYKTRENQRKIIGAADLGLLRVYRQTADSQTVIKQFNLLQESQALDSLKEHGWYELGQFYMQYENWFEAKKALAEVSVDHYDYPFAQYSMVICDEMDNIKDRDNDTLKYARSFARSHLKEIIAFNAVTESQKQIQERAKYLLGITYYENNENKNAWETLKEISDTSVFYHDGLNILGWAVFKIKQWELSRDMAEIMQKSDKLDVKADGYILEAYSLILDTTMGKTLERLERAKECSDKALELLKDLERCLTVDISKIKTENDSLKNMELEIIENYHKMLESDMERQFLFKNIEKSGKNVSVAHDKILYNLSEIEKTYHYQSIIDRITAIINDAEYLGAIVEKRLLFEKNKNIPDNKSEWEKNDE